MKKSVLFISFGFLITSLLGAYSIELVRINTAKKIGYSAKFNTTVARTEFWNDELNKDFDKLYEGYKDDIESLKKTSEWVRIDKAYQKAFAKIEGTALIFTGIVSLAGIGLIFFRRKNKFLLINWIGIFMSLVFMRYVIINTVELFIGFKWCVEADILTYYDLPIKSSLILFEIVSLFLAVWIFFQIPKMYRITFLITGFIFGIIAALIWVKYAELVLP